MDAKRHSRWIREGGHYDVEMKGWMQKGAL